MHGKIAGGYTDQSGITGRAGDGKDITFDNSTVGGTEQATCDQPVQAIPGINPHFTKEQMQANTMTLSLETLAAQWWIPVMVYGVVFEQPSDEIRMVDFILQMLAGVGCLECDALQPISAPPPCQMTAPGQISSLFCWDCYGGSTITVKMPEVIGAIVAATVLAQFFLAITCAYTSQECIVDHFRCVACTARDGIGYQVSLAAGMQATRFTAMTDGNLAGPEACFVLAPAITFVIVVTLEQRCASCLDCADFVVTGWSIADEIRVLHNMQYHNAIVVGLILSYLFTLADYYDVVSALLALDWRWLQPSNLHGDNVLFGSSGGRIKNVPKTNIPRGIKSTGQYGYATGISHQWQLLKEGAEGMVAQTTLFFGCLVSMVTVLGAKNGVQPTPQLIASLRARLESSPNEILAGPLTLAYNIPIPDVTPMCPLRLQSLPNLTRNFMGQNLALSFTTYFERFATRFLNGRDGVNGYELESLWGDSPFSDALGRSYEREREGLGLLRHDLLATKTYAYGINSYGWNFIAFGILLWKDTEIPVELVPSCTSRRCCPSGPGCEFVVISVVISPTLAECQAIVTPAPAPAPVPCPTLTCPEPEVPATCPDAAGGDADAMNKLQQEIITLRSDLAAKDEALTKANTAAAQVAASKVVEAAPVSSNSGSSDSGLVIAIIAIVVGFLALASMGLYFALRRRPGEVDLEAAGSRRA
jgi:hypothetical protein